MTIAEIDLATTAETRLTGGRRSMAILERLRKDRIGSQTDVRAGRTISDLRWLPAQSYAIQREPTREIWHAGHVSAILSDDNIVIVGTQTGGVWLINPSIQPHFRQGHQAFSLSNDWDAPDVTCLAYGPAGNEQVFAGGADSYVLVLIELKTLLGAMELRQTTSIPLPSSATIYGIAIVPDPHRIVIATASGVWWSALPATISNASQYAWQMAQGLPAGTYSGIAVGPSGSVAVSAWGNPGVPDSYGLFRGVWKQGALTFARATINGSDATTWRRTSIASCGDQPTRMYAVAGQSEAAGDGIQAVVASSDGGATWQAVAIPPNPGNLADYNNCITVSPYRPNVVAIGWRSSGPFFSVDSGATWTQPSNDRTNGHLHSDLHALHFARNPSGGDHLYVGSDGGIAATPDLGQTFQTQYSRPLGNLQFYGGALTASSRFPGLLAGGTQDNGNIYLTPKQEAGSAWRTLEGGDGGINRFVDPIKALLRNNNTLLVNKVEIGNRVRIAFWDELTSSFDSEFGTVLPADGNTAGVMPSSIEVVIAPAWKKNGQLMYAAVGSGAGGTVYGLFADADGTNARLTGLGTAGKTVSALASRDGASLLAGTVSGRIVLLDSASGNVSEQTVPPGLLDDGAVKRIEILTSSDVYALFGRQLVPSKWPSRRRVSRRVWTSFAVDAASGRIFACNDGDVFLSIDRGRTWTDASQGLPVRPHCSDLRIAPDADGGRQLYLGTYGRSVWRTTIALLPPESLEILFGVIQDGGGVVRIGKRLVKVPPRPWIRDLLAALVIEDIAGSMSETSGRAIRQASLEQMERIVRQEREAIE